MSHWPPNVTPLPPRRPEWIKVRPLTAEAAQLRQLLDAQRLHTVCEEARCPNRNECWRGGTATFLILGEVCTRACRFCAVRHGRPEPLDGAEPERVVAAARLMGLRHVVVTSVDRDDLPDGGAGVFAAVIRRLRAELPECTVEVLVPDFRGRVAALEEVIAARPHVLGHNIETVPRLFRALMPQSRYHWSQTVLVAAKERAAHILTKSGLMVGLGETAEEVVATLTDLRAWGVDIVTVGQYLPPSRQHWPLARYYTPEEFQTLRAFARDELKFGWVECAPLVRSSYRAAMAVEALRGGGR